MQVSVGPAVAGQRQNRRNRKQEKKSIYKQVRRGCPVKGKADRHEIGSLVCWEKLERNCN